MTEYQLLKIDPWFNEAPQATCVPADSIFLCAYDVHLQIETVTEAAFVRRTVDRDELWLAIELGSGVLDHLVTSEAMIEIERSQVLSLGCAVVARRASSIESASKKLLDALFRARVGFSWPRKPVLGGTIDEQSFWGLVGAIEAELENNARQASRDESQIIAAARELGMSPEPTGTGPHHWQARCPGTNHGLMIQSATNEFGCGYCRRKGGPQELREFVEQRRDRERS